ncbi:MAG: type III-B CRISPR module RAMP protein Cmr6 [Bernardetiaceae bacterium]|nr:type III-B CRISPR module RAMP protein Cmr6 [Bernardetiaceae bacterium]
MAKQDKKQNTSNSLQDLAKLTGMENEIKSTTPQDTAQNFYSFLHKRERFWAETQRVNNEDDKDRKKFVIKKINVESVVEKPAGNKNKLEDISIIDVFEKEKKGWQKTPFYQSFIARHHHNALQLTSGNLLPKVYDNKQKNELQFKPDWRLAIGLGSGSVFETSITLHHIYGFPYIPASAVKGALRSYLITTLQGTEKDSEALLFHNSKEMCDIFGCGEETLYDENKKRKSTFYKRCFEEDKQQFGKDKSKYRYPEITEKEGDVIFFDAYPTHSPQGCIKADIMNPHYPNYYGYDVNHTKFQPPADWQSPVPIIFLTVEKLTFQFMVGLQKGIENENITLGSKSGDMLSVVAGYLKDALQDKGIGAKTAVGYGYMKAQ